MADSNPRQIRGKIKQIVGNPDVVPKKTKGGKHKYYKKPGKGHNHDTCDACGDAGDILCCDSCPASFHLTCFDPPLQEKDLPKGGWKCRACTLKKCRYVKTMMPNLEKSFELFENPDVGCKGLHNLFRLMGEHWRKQNPKMYTLPTNVANYPPQFPGYSKASTLKGKSATPKPKANAPTKEKENKVTVKRTTVCFSCDKSHAKGVILKCDYCPALYHLDCLDPPLTSPPSGFWMCPLHAQPFLEAKYLTSSALSERVRVWDMAEANKNRGMRTLVSFASSIHGRYSNIKAEVILPTKPKVQIPVVINEIYKRYRESKITEKSKTEIINKIDSVSVTNPLPNGESCKRKIDMEEGDKTKSEAPNLPSLLRPGAVFKSGFDLLLAASELTNEETVDKCLQGISPLMVKLLAFQALSNNPRLAPTYNHTLDPSQDLDIILSHGHPIHVQSGGPMVQIKRMRLEPTFKLVYLNGGKLLDFHRRMLEIGVGGSAGLDLQTLGYCVNVSRGHAKIFYDSIKCQWELLNYSPQGSWINGILYGCDTTVYAAGLPQDETLRTFKDIVDHKRQKLLEQRNPKESISGILAKNGNCACLKELPQKPASCWEGSAIIQKGDQLQFGCHKFVVVETGVIPKFNSSPSTATPSASGPSSSGPAICFPAASAASASAVSASVPSTSRSGTSFPADPAPGTSAASASTPITSSQGAPAPGTSGSGTCFPAASAASALALSTSASVPSGSTPSTSFNENEQNIIPAMDIDGGCGSSDVP